MKANDLVYFLGAGVFIYAIWPLPTSRYFLAWGGALIMLFSYKMIGGA